MSTPLERIKGLINALPKKDVNLGKKFLEERNFKSLQELVDSAVFKINKRIKNSQTIESVDIDRLDSLKAEIDLYSWPLIKNYEEQIYEEENDEF